MKESVAASVTAGGRGGIFCRVEARDALENAWLVGNGVENENEAREDEDKDEDEDC